MLYNFEGLPLDAIIRLKEKLSQGEMDALAAVAIILRPDGDDLEVLLVKRAIVPGDPWSGDMAFPGGKKNLADLSLRATVYREVLEETGINLDEAIYLGTMPVLFSALRNGMSVLPILYGWAGEPEVHLNYELTGYRWLHLSDLLNRRRTANVKGWENPVYDLGDEIIWGLTYRMLEKLLDFLGENLNLK